MGMPPVGEASGRFALRAPPLLVLTQDALLLEVLKAVTDPVHEVCVAGSEVDFSATLLAHHGGVAVLDCAATAAPIAQLTERLHTQFPELVLIVAGSIDEQGRLAAQIADGSVHRFLHKPFSEQRVRLFVEAAWRRHAEALAAPATRAAPAARRARAGRRWPVIVACAAIATPLVWLATHTAPPLRQGAPALPSNAGAATGDAALEGLLARADLALERGALTAPAGASAADLYREALRRNAGEPRALNGLEQVIGQLLSRAEAQLQQGRLDAAQQLADQARAISPHHARVAFVVAQISAQRERAVLDKAQRAAAGGDVTAALAVLDDASRGGHRSKLVDEARQQLAQKQLDARVADYLNRGSAALQRGQLIAPVEDNARFYLESARALAPNDPLVQQATRDLIARLESEARSALAAKDAEQADTWASAAANAGADPVHVAALHEQAQQLRRAARAESLAQLSSAFDERLAQGRLLEPASDSARYYLTQLIHTDPADPATQRARTTFAARLLEEARSTLRAQDFATTRRWLDEARASGADEAATAELERALSAAQHEAQQADTYVNESTLTRTRYVAPKFPDEARLRGINGWVELQYLVGTDGTVSDVTVVGAQPVGVFEQAALDAVRHWRYQPVLRAGQLVSQRTRLRLRFTVQP
jgi:TonB family protein